MIGPTRKRASLAEADVANADDLVQDWQGYKGVHGELRIPPFE